MAVSGIRVRSAASGEGGRSRHRAVQSGADRRGGRLSLQSRLFGTD